MENSSKKPTNRAVAIIPEGIEFPSFLAGFAIEKTSFVDISALAERPFVLIIAPRKDFLQHTIQQIRSHSQTALMPLIVAGGENQQEDNPLIDVSVPLLFSDSQIRQAFEKAISLSEKISRFTPPPDSLEAREQGWLNLVRFLSSRGGFKLAPSWNIKTPSGYEYPPVATILDTQQEETAQLQLLTQMGLLEKTFYDKIHLCPRCRHFQLNFREVCPHCNKSDVEPEENFHHYSCSFVAPRREFMSGGVLACPKCHKKLKALGVDYDKSSVSHYCNSCKKNFSESLVNCLCLFCANSFPPVQADIQTIYEYRLSPLGHQAAQNGFISQDKLKEFLHKQLGVLDYDLFRKMLEIETNISRRHTRNLCLIKLIIQNYSQDADLYGLWGKLIGNLRESLRINDLVTWLSGDELLILSIDTDIKQAQQAICRIQQNIAAEWSQISLQPQFASLSSQNWEQILNEFGPLSKR